LSMSLSLFNDFVMGNGVINHFSSPSFRNTS